MPNYTSQSLLKSAQTHTGVVHTHETDLETD